MVIMSLMLRKSSALEHSVIFRRCLSVKREFPRRNLKEMTMRYLILCKLQKLKTHKNPLKHAVYGQIKKCLFTISTYILYTCLKYCFKRGKNEYEQKTQHCA